MLATKGFIGIVFIAFLEVISFDRFYANNQSCYEVANKTICYFQPNVTNTLMTWDEAWNVCKEKSSTLPVIDNRMTTDAFRRHMDSKHSIPVDMWLAGREIRTDEWRWLNGKPFGRQNSFADLDRRKSSYDTNAVITGQLQYMWTWARIQNCYICHYNDSELCQNKSIIRWKNGYRLVKNDESLTFMDARNRCLDGGGDLATFEEDEDLEMLRNDSSLLSKCKNYWIGLRQNWWIWNETAKSKEIKYSNWLNYDSLLSKHCLYIRLIDYKWDQSDCTAKKTFLCQTVTTTSNTHGTDVESFLSTRLPEAQMDVSASGVLILTVVSILVVTILLVVVIVAMIIWKRKAKTRHSDQTRVETDGDYQDLRRRQDNPGSNEHYMELQGITNQPAALNPDYQNISDYEDVIVSHN